MCAESFTPSNIWHRYFTSHTRFSKYDLTFTVIWLRIVQCHCYTVQNISKPFIQNFNFVDIIELCQWLNIDSEMDTLASWSQQHN